jgi:hypothetical protein
MGTPSTYRDTVAHFTRWAFGQRMVHDLVVHPLMALTRYSDWSLKLHDYHSFAAMKPGDKRTIGIMGHVEDVQAAFVALGVEIENAHTDGVICCGTGKPNSIPRKRRCPSCDGRGGWYSPARDPKNSDVWVRCYVCMGCGT